MTLRTLLLGPRQPAELSGARRVVTFFGSMWDLAAYLYLAVASLVALSRRGGAPAAVMQPLHAAFPLLLAPALLVGVVGLLRRRGLQFLAAMALLGVCWFTIAPARSAPSVRRPPDSMTLTILQANVLYSNLSAAEVAATILRVDADVVTLEEVSGAIDAALQVGGVYDRYPHRRVLVRDGPAGAALLSKLPFEDLTPSDATAMPAALIDVAVHDQVRTERTAKVRIDVAHPFPPLDAASNRAWTSWLKRLRARVAQERLDGATPAVVIGDFNATRWQPAFGAVLAAGARDVHEALGHGLSTSWPQNAAVPRLVRLDHALVWGGVVPLGVRDLTIEGSDHRGFVVTIAVPSVPVDHVGADGIS